MRTAKRLAQRRAINHRLAAQDRANRCAYCLVALNGLIYRTFGHPEQFCSWECRDTYAAQAKGQR